MPEQDYYEGTVGWSVVRRLTTLWLKDRARRRYMTEFEMNGGRDEATARAMYDYDGPIFESKRE